MTTTDQASTHVPTTASPAAAAAAIGFGFVAAFQAALAFGAPLGQAAWGGTHPGTLPSDLRIASAVTIIVQVIAALLVLRRGGWPVRLVPAAAARWGVRFLIGLTLLGVAANLASSSGWERYFWAPYTLALTVLCIMTTRSRRPRGA